MQIKTVMYFFLGLLASFSAYSGPFGLDKGMTLSDLQRHGKFTPTETPNVYKAAKLKSGHASFEGYLAFVSPNTGLCKITASGVDIRSNSFGDQLQKEFRSLEEAIKKKYGEPSDEFDFLQDGSIWKDRNDWMMALYKEERSLATYWNKRDLPDQIKAIGLTANALSGSVGWVVLTYEFNNVSECLQELNKKENSNL